MKNLLLSILSILTITAYGQLVPTTTNVSAPQPPSITGKTGNIFSNSIKNTNGAGYAAFAASVGNSFGAGYTSLFGTDPNKNAYIYNSRGLLIPRLTTGQRDAVAAPQTGLMVFNTTTNRFNWYSGGTWNEVGTGSGTVTDVTGTAGRITSTGGATPQIDIDGSYTGQNSITTLGSISSGTWNASLIDKAYGGTGVDISSAALSLGTGSGTAGRLAFLNASNNNTVTIAPGATSGDYTFTLPVDDGAASQYLQTDGNGVTSWQTIASSGWSVTGNSGLVDGTNFIGNIDNVPFNIRVNNLRSGRIDPNNGTTFYGYRAGNSTTSGQSNTAIGFRALDANITNEGNTAVGYNSMQQTRADYNTAVGVTSLLTNVTGTSNTAVGYGADVTTNSTTGAVALGAGATAATNEFAIPNGVTNFKFQGDSYTLPTTFPGTNGEILSSTTGGVLTWESGVGGCEVSCGTYTPTLNGITNIDALTAYQCQYLRVGDNVTVSGMLLVDVTNTATDSEFTITLPIASTFSSGDFGIGGAGSFINIEGSTALVCGPGDTFGSFRWLSSATTTTAQRISFTFTYQIL